MSTKHLASIDGRAYIDLVKERLRDDEAWQELLAPPILARTQWALQRLIDSIDGQRALAAYTGDYTPGWVRSTKYLRSLAQARLDALPQGVERER